MRPNIYTTSSARKQPVTEGLFAGIKDSFTGDALSGFLVFLLAMPLSLGIAKASDFPPIYGIITAIIGGLVVSFFAGSRLTIKGPAAGLIVICSGAVAEFGGGDLGWHYALGAIVVAGVIQVLFGILKLGKLSDFVPSSAVHGMLAAIGVIIFSKQIHVLLGVDPKSLKGLEPLELLGHIPASLAMFDWKPAIIGVTSLVILLGMPMIKPSWGKMIPAPLVVLLIAIPMELEMDFRHTEPAFNLVSIGSLLDAVKANVDFGGWAQTGVFIKYVILFALIGTIESLLTVKAIDNMDPERRKSNTNKDLLAIGIGNIFSGILGGLPMISEVARSSSNVFNGAKTRWANFFHGFWLLVFVLAARPFIELIPNAALAAMLIFVGYKLAHPKEFRHALHIGKEQLIVFVATIVITLATDLLVGVLSGILLELVINAILSKSGPGALFRTSVTISDQKLSNIHVRIAGCAAFSNYLGIKARFDELPAAHHVSVDLSALRFADHTVLKNLHDIGRDYKSAGGEFHITGLADMKALGETEDSARLRLAIA